MAELGRRTEAMVHRMTHGGQVPYQRLSIISGAANVARGVGRPCQCIHGRLMLCSSATGSVGYLRLAQP